VRVEVGLRARTTRQPVGVTWASGEPHQGSIVVGELRLGAGGPAATPQVALDYRIGDTIELSGYDPPRRVEFDQSIVYRLYWRALAETGEDYTVFAHLIDAGGELVSQRDSPPFDGDYPTSWWRAGESFVEERAIPLPEDTGRVGAFIELGVYRPANVTRLPIFGAGGARLPDDRVLIPLDAGP
jgi:hypothetical protein